MIETIVLRFLKDKMKEHVYLENPGNNIKNFILIEKIGGGKESHLNRATLAIQSYAGSLAEAAKINESVKHAMEGIVELDEIGSCELNADYNWTDTNTKRYRYQSIYNLIYY